MSDARTDNGSDSRRQHRARGQSALGHDVPSNKARGPSYEENRVLLGLWGFFMERRTRRRILGPSHPRLQQVEKEREQDQVSMALSACERSRDYNPRILFEHVYRADFETAQSELGISQIPVGISPPWNPEILYLAASRSDPESHNIVWLLIIKDILKDWKNRESVSKEKMIMMMSMAVLAALKNNAFLNAWILRAFGAAWVPECRWRVQVPDDAYWKELQNKLEQWTPDTYLLPENGMEGEVLVQFIDAQGRMDFKRMLNWATRHGNMDLLECVLLVSKELGLGLLEERYVDIASNSTLMHAIQGVTILHLAVHCKQRAVIKRLVREGAQINVQSVELGWTPLHLAAAEGWATTVTLLLSLGADVDMDTHNGETAYKLAENRSQSVVIEAMTSHVHQDTDDILKVLDAYGSIPSRPPETYNKDGQLSSHPGFQHDAERSHGLCRSEDQCSITTQPSTTRDGSFDGTILTTSNSSGEELAKSQAFDVLLETVRDPAHFQFQKWDTKVRIAILDTGLDRNHSDWQNGRILRFDATGTPQHDEHDPKQNNRIMEYKNFVKDSDPNDITDVDGHGTQVAGIILRLAHRAEIYVARVCNKKKDGIEPQAVVDAISWAIEKKVHLINMSCGFPRSNAKIEEVLCRAQEAKQTAPRIVTFAAMSNDGNIRKAAFPASDPSLTIGIHSCKDHLGRKSSSFTPGPIAKSDNFMAVGEKVVTHWPGGEFKLAEGTSFSTPVATAMAAIILSFMWQRKCKDELKKLDADFGEQAILKTSNMAKVLKGVSVPTSGQYNWIHPRLLWKDFDSRKSGDHNQQAWNVITNALTS